MTKAQFNEIVQHITKNYGANLRLRLNLLDGNWVQGDCQVLGTRSIMVMQDNKQPAYVDLEKIVTITCG